jgi:hypothetical protein
MGGSTFHKTILSYPTINSIRYLLKNGGFVNFRTMVDPKEFKKNIKRKNYPSNSAIMSALKLEEKIISDSSEVVEYESTYLFYSILQELIKLLDYIYFKNILSTFVTKRLLNFNTWKICSKILQTLYRLNSREEKILFDLHYDLRSKLNFEKAKNQFKNDQFEAKLFLMNNLSQLI